MNAPPAKDYFETLFDASEDPWRFRSSWYEARKRALTLAGLPRERYRCGFEPGCANGELSAALAQRCDRLVVSDVAQAAVELARRRLSGFAHVEVLQATVPDQWPAESFDLLVISELGYYLDAEALDAVAAKVRASLSAGGTVLACHWRWPIAGCLFDGDEVHRRLDERLGLRHLTRLSERDLLLDVWSDDGRSVGEQEGLTP